MIKLWCPKAAWKINTEKAHERTEVKNGHNKMDKYWNFICRSQW